MRYVSSLLWQLYSWSARHSPRTPSHETMVPWTGPVKYEATAGMRLTGI